VSSFRLQYNSSVEQLYSDFQAQLNIRVKSAEMGAKYIASLPDVGAGRGVFIPGFQALAEDLLNVSNAQVGTWLMLVTDAQRPAFEAAAAQAATRLDPSGELEQQVLSDGIRVSVPGGQGAVSGYMRAPPAPLYVAAWANAPRSVPRLENYFLFDAFSEPVRRAALQRVLVRVLDLFACMCVPRAMLTGGAAKSFTGHQPDDDHGHDLLHLR
jgi:hypothetical protein